MAIVLSHPQWSRHQNQDFLGMNLPRAETKVYDQKVLYASFRMISDQKGELWMKNRILWQVTSQGSAEHLRSRSPA